MYWLTRWLCCRDNLSRGKRNVIDSTSISINGEPLVSFQNMFMVMHVLIHVIGCILAVILSLRTIPKEYERHNSHLAWVRGISQVKYHGGLAAVISIGLFVFKKKERCYDCQEKQEEECEILRGYGLELNLAEGTLEKKGQGIPLTRTEFRILELLMKTPGRIYTKQQIFGHSWDEPYKL